MRLGWQTGNRSSVHQIYSASLARLGSWKKGWWTTSFRMIAKHARCNQLRYQLRKACCPAQMKASMFMIQGSSRISSIKKSRQLKMVFLGKSHRRIPTGLPGQGGCMGQRR